jgi:hypothetical protein
VYIHSSLLGITHEDKLLLEIETHWNGILSCLRLLSRYRVLIQVRLHERYDEDVSKSTRAKESRLHEEKKIQ